MCQIHGILHIMLLVYVTTVQRKGEKKLTDKTQLAVLFSGTDITSFKKSKLSKLV